MTTTICRKFEFDTAHRVLGHQGKCRHLHGHRYVAEVVVKAPELNDLGMVIDFAALKDKVGGWIDRTWDHNVLFHPDDPLLKPVVVEAMGSGKLPVTLEEYGGVGRRELLNPTAENIARFLAFKAADLLAPDGMIVVSVKIFETPNCWAEYLCN
jgi:6-pyruvoyltetrahydropterin/6-carboxytetrahydropterin synthase